MVDVDKITWRTVSINEYNESDFRQPHRITYDNFDIVRYEIGTLPRELPTRRGAIIVPTAEYLNKIEYVAETFFIFDGNNWGWVISTDAWFDESENKNAQEALDNGGTIVFDGIPDASGPDDGQQANPDAPNQVGGRI